MRSFQCVYFFHVQIKGLSSITGERPFLIDARYVKMNALKWYRVSDELKTQPDDKSTKNHGSDH